MVRGRRTGCDVPWNEMTADRQPSFLVPKPKGRHTVGTREEVMRALTRYLSLEMIAIHALTGALFGVGLLAVGAVISLFLGRHSRTAP